MSLILQKNVNYEMIAASNSSLLYVAFIFDASFFHIFRVLRLWKFYYMKLVLLTFFPHFSYNTQTHVHHSVSGLWLHFHFIKHTLHFEEKKLFFLLCVRQTNLFIVFHGNVDRITEHIIENRQEQPLKVAKGH